MKSKTIICIIYGVISGIFISGMLESFHPIWVAGVCCITLLIKPILSKDDLEISAHMKFTISFLMNAMILLLTTLVRGSVKTLSIALIFLVVAFFEWKYSICSNRWKNARD